MHNYHVGLLEITEIEQVNHEEIPHSLQERFFEGLIVHWGLAERFRKILPVLDIPAVWWDVGLFAQHNCLDRDETKVAQILTERLIKLGHRRIGLMMGQRSWQRYQRTGKPPHYSYELRYESYRAQLRRHNMQEVPLVGYEATALAAQLRRHRLTAVITQSVASVPIVQLAAQTLGWRVPQDLSIAAFDVETRIRPTYKRIGGMSYDRYAIGRQAAEMLLKILQSRDKTVPSVKFAGEFYAGDTIGPPRQS
jgi:DNA-binding LacI/PurR family transcriptional regulator